MKYLLPLILVCTLMCGCSRDLHSQKDAASLPPLSAAGESLQPEAYQGSVQTAPLNLNSVQGLRIFGGNLLLFSGEDNTTLTLLDPETLETRASVSLRFRLNREDPSLVFHSDGTLSYFDPELDATVVVNNTLQEDRRISAPGGLRGSPILSGDGKTVFYCTASHVRAWDLERGIHRCVKEMAYDSQEVTGVFLSGAFLQCRVTEAGESRSLILFGEDGRLLYEGNEGFSLSLEADRYCAALPAGSCRVLVFGSESGQPQMLAPADLGAETFLLPEQEAVLTASELQSGRVRLEYYRLSTGLRSFQLTLGANQTLTDAVCLDADDLALLVHDTAAERDWLILWQLRGNSPLAVADSTCYTSLYFSADAPDPEGLARCRTEADRIGKKYGIRILLGEEALQTSGREPEHLVPVVQKELALLEQRLSRFPDRILQETAAHFDSVNLCLVRSLPELPGGPCSARHPAEGDAYMIITPGTQGEQALYHQLFHLMEVHILSNSGAYDRWETLNPAGFQYDYDYTANAARDSGVYLLAQSRYFADTFAMSFPREDRAEIWKNALLPGKEALFASPGMQEKLRTLCAGIRDAYDLQDTEYPWEQYLE